MFVLKDISKKVLGNIKEKNKKNKYMNKYIQEVAKKINVLKDISKKVLGNIREKNKKNKYMTNYIY
jgi:hypothetical protein